MENYEIYLARNFNTNETIDGPDRVYRDYETIENAFQDIISDFADYCGFDLDSDDVNYDYEERCATCTFINRFTNQEEVCLVYIREIEEEIL